MKYQFIEQYQQEFPVVVLCGVLGVSESGYYAWRKRRQSRHKQEDARLTTHIQDVFVSRRGVYGSPRIHAELRDQGWRCSRKRIARLRPREWDGCPAQAFSSGHHQKQSQARGGTQPPRAGFYGSTAKCACGRGILRTFRPHRDGCTWRFCWMCFKDECVHRTVYHSHEEARQSLFEYLEGVYNRQRRHSSLGYLSPAAFEQQWELSAKNLAVF